MLHPPYTEPKEPETPGGVAWMEENWGIEEDSALAGIYRDLESVLSEPPEEEVVEDEARTLCWPDPARDTKWKYCGYYTGLERPEDEEQQDADLGQLFEFDVRPPAILHYTVVDVRNDDAEEEVKTGVTIKFFFNYDPPAGSDQ